MAKVNIKAAPYVGEYELDLEAEPATMLEWRWIKQISGYLPTTITAGLRGGDPDLDVALAVIALVRAGKVGEQDALTAAERLVRHPLDAIDFQEEEASPPAEPAVTPVPLELSRSSG